MYKRIVIVLESPIQVSMKGYVTIYDDLRLQNDNSKLNVLK